MHRRHSFFHQAWKGDPSGVLYIAGLLMVLVVYFLVSLAFFGVLSWYDENWMSRPQEQILNPELLGMPPGLGLLLLLLPFAAGLLAIWIAIRFIHRRAFITVLSSASSFDWRKAGLAAGLWVGISLVFEISLALLDPENYIWTFDPVRFFPTLLVALIFIPLQASMEEVLFRGYLMQWIGKGFKSPWVALLTTSILFGLMHGANPEIDEFGSALLLYYIGFGLVMGIATLMDEGLELAIGVHVGNNLYSSLIISFPSSALQTPTIFTLKEFPLVPMLVVGVIGATLFMMFVARKYQWTDWRKLIESISEPA